MAAASDEGLFINEYHQRIQSYNSTMKCEKKKHCFINSSLQNHIGLAPKMIPSRIIISIYTKPTRNKY